MRKGNDHAATALVRHDTNNGVSFFGFDHFEQTGIVAHGFSTRLGGTSTGVCSTMNLSFGREDNRENVAANFRLMGQAIGFNPDSLTFSWQTHETQVCHVTAEHKGNGFLRKNSLEGYDALTTNTRGVTLTTFHADCVPLFFVDPQAKAIGLAHAGWRGTLGAIGPAVVEKMTAMFGCQPQHILAGIGPSIGPCCFEVDRPVAALFLEQHPWSKDFVIAHPQDGKFHIDLWAINRRLLIDKGLLPAHVKGQEKGHEICTQCHPDLFFSHRFHGENRGSMAAFLELKP